MVGARADEYGEAIRRTTLEPEQNRIRLDSRSVINDTKKHFKRMAEENPELVAHFRAGIRRSNDVSKEVYAPIRFDRKLIAIANVHFNEHTRQLTEYAHNLERGLSRYGLQLYRAIRNQLEEARFKIDEIRTKWGFKPNEQARKAIDDVMSDRASSMPGEIGSIVQRAIREDRRYTDRVLSATGGKPGEFQFDSKKQTKRIMGLVVNESSFIEMLALLFRGFACESECFVDYGYENDIPLVYIAVYPTAKGMRDALISMDNQRDFHSSDVFPTEPKWSRHVLDFACEARTLAVLAGGQVRLGERKLPKNSAIRESLKADTAPAFQIELPKIGILYPPLIES